MYSKNKEKTQNDNRVKMSQTEETDNTDDIEQNHESDYDEVDQVIDQDLTNLLIEEDQPAQRLQKTTDCMINKNKLASIPGFIIILQNMLIFANLILYSLQMKQHLLHKRK